MMLWPQAWPMPGSASYSAQMATCSGRAGARRTLSAGRRPRDDAKPRSSSTSESHAPPALLETDLGVRVDAMAQRDQPLGLLTYEPGDVLLE